MLSIDIRESHDASPCILIYILLISLVVTEATILPIYYCLPLDAMIGLIIIGYVKSRSTKHKMHMLIAMYITLQNMILLGMDIYNGIRALFQYKK